MKVKVKVKGKGKGKMKDCGLWLRDSHSILGKMDKKTNVLYYGNCFNNRSMEKNNNEEKYYVCLKRKVF